MKEKQTTSPIGPIERLNPLVKLIYLAAGTVLVLVCDRAAVAVGLVVVTIAGLWLNRIPPWRIPGKWLQIAIATSLIAVHALMLRQGRPVLGAITYEGLEAGCLAAGRIVAVLLMGTLFVTSTDPTELGQSLIAAGLPYRWAFALIAAIRMVPLFKNEANIVYWAQLTRGVRYDAGPIKRRWLMLQKLLLPLIVSSLRSAHALAATMENRGFGMYKHRTSLKQVRFGIIDAIAIIMAIAAGTIIIAWSCR